MESLKLKLAGKEATVRQVPVMWVTLACVRSLTELNLIQNNELHQPAIYRNCSSIFLHYAVIDLKQTRYGLFEVMGQASLRVLETVAHPSSFNA